MTDRQRLQAAARQRRFRERAAGVRRSEQAAKGLPALPSIPTIPGKARWAGMLALAYALLCAAESEKASYYEDRSEAWQEGDAGAQFLEEREGLEAVVSQLSDLT